MLSLEELKSSQPEAVTHIQQVFASGRLHHAYVMAGPDESASAALAMAMATQILCKESQDPENCICRKKLAGGNHPDFLSIGPDEKGKIRIDTIREMAGRLSLRAIEAERKVILIQGADTMNAAAQNALLKTLEEPPGPSCFILTVKRFRSLLPTVRSRSQRIRLEASNPEAAIETLIAGGVQPDTAPALAALVGDNVDAALDKIEHGAEDILSTLRQAMQPENLGEVPEMAQFLGANRVKAELSLQLLAVELRNQLAYQLGATPNRRLGGPIESLDRSHLVGAITRLEQLQKDWVFNPNEKLGLESVLLCLKGSHS